MSSWPAAKASRVLAALQRIGWRHDRTVGSHKIMKKDGWRDYPFSFHDSDELGPAILAKSQKRPAFNPKTCEVLRLAGPKSRYGKRGTGRCRLHRDPLERRLTNGEVLPQSVRIKPIHYKSARASIGEIRAAR